LPNGTTANESVGLNDPSWRGRCYRNESPSIACTMPHKDQLIGIRSRTLTRRQLRTVESDLPIQCCYLHRVEPRQISRQWQAGLVIRAMGNRFHKWDMVTATIFSVRWGWLRCRIRSTVYLFFYAILRSRFFIIVFARFLSLLIILVSRAAAIRHSPRDLRGRSSEPI
jgi:hypothetical protein